MKMMTYVCLLAISLAMGCKKKPKKVVGPVTKVQPKKPVAVKVAYPLLGQAVRLVAAGLRDGTCAARSTPSCKGYREAGKLLAAKGKGPESLSTLAQLSNDADANVATVAGFLFFEGRRRDIGTLFRAAGKGEQSLDPKTVDLLIRGLANLEGYAANRAAPVVAWAASLTGKIDALAKVVEEHKNRRLASYAIAELMTFGRLKSFGKVQQYGKHRSPVLNHAALKAPQRMPRWSDEERKVICPWALPFLASANLKIATQAAHLMVRCKFDDKYIEALLAEGKKRVDAGQWKTPFDFPYRDICFAGFLGKQKRASPALCKKTYAFLRSVADNKKVDAKMRARALSWIIYQRRDQASIKLLKKYKAHKVPEIAKVAKEGIAMLERAYAKKKK